MTESKILLFIVEGPSDEASLAPAMEQIAESSTVKFKVMHSDIVSDYGSTPTNIEKRIKKFAIARFLEGSPFTVDDIYGIIHIVDLDGAFTPNDIVISAEVADVEYHDDKIICNDRDKFIRSKDNKCDNLRHLITLSKIKIPHGKEVPYVIYYMGCNLDHVLHNKRNPTVDEKKFDSILFADEYDDPVKFERFFNTADIKVPGSYEETWAYIQNGLNSLKRCSNFNLCIEYVKSIGH